MPYDVNQALKDGVPEGEIANYLGKTRNFDIKGAFQEGYSYKEIIDHLSTKKGIETKPQVAKPALPSPLVPERPPMALTPPGLARPEVPPIKKPVIDL